MVSKMADYDQENITYTQFACIGTGFGGIGLGATLKRWYGITDVRFFERHGQLGGTWYISQYPGCACDVPAHLYSFSFERNPGWTRFLPSSNELWEYQKMVAEKYDLVSKMSFNSNVERCEWIESRSRWRLYVRDSTTNRIFIHESQFLFGASGGLVTPNELDVPGIESFKGQVFHSGRWRHDVSLEGKDVVIFGNGCTAAQVVPNIVKKTGHLTQIVRSKHWIMPSIDYEQSPASKVLMKWIPGLMALQRFFVFCVAENEFRAFPMTRAAAAFRERKRKLADKYMRETAPKKYHDILIPEFEISCKRRIFDSGYLKSLHEPNLTLTNSPALEIVPEGVRTKDGTIKADVIILANGFKTNYFVGGVDIIGRNGETFAEHWSSFGGPEAYNTCALSGFPNFFMLLGPNSATGHTSAIMAAENSINYALRIIKPVLDGKATVTEVKLEAEKKYSDKIQNDLRKTVWFSGCQSWYIKSDAKKPGQKWNAMSYPYSQAHFWYRSLFPVWSDWKIYGPATRKSRLGLKLFISVALCAAAVPVLRANGWEFWKSIEFQDSFKKIWQITR